MQTIGRLAPFAVLFCAAAHLFTLTRQFDFPRAPDRLGPDVWPQTILVLLMMACAIRVGGGLLARRGPQQAQPQEPPRGVPAAPPSHALAKEPASPSRYGLALLGLLLFLAYPLALEYFGFLLATFPLMALFMLVGQWRSLFGVAAVSAAGALGLFYVFRGLVYVSLPLGTGPFQSATLWVASLLGMR
jgi:tripartite tricarboxylate transporter TctB family protein